MVATHKHPIVEELIEITGQDPADCYQCGKCSAGCPVREFAAEAPNKIVRYMQLGFYDKALMSKTPWLCAGCLTCSSRCPQSFDLARFMDAIREMALHHKVEIPEGDTLKFHQSFLKQIRSYGRAFEFGLVLDYKMKSFHLFQDADVAPEMFMKGKIGLMPHKIHNRDKVKEIFAKIEEENKK
jgi:heterodisulfide reductase subunit C2